MPSKYRWSAINVVLGVGAMYALMALLTRWALSRDLARIALFVAVRGWNFRTRDADVPARFSVFPFAPGRGGAAVNVLTGRHRFHECSTFAYVVRRPAPQMYQVTLVELDARPPTLELLPEDLVAAVAKATGGQDLTVGNPTSMTTGASSPAMLPLPGGC